VKPGGYLFVSGVDLDVRAKVAGDLGWRGIACMLIEQTNGDIVQPKMDGVNVRTMEFCRRWGIVDRIKSCPYPPSYPQDMVYLTSLTGFELGREAFQTPSGGVEDRLSGPSPEVRVRCPQNMFDPILRAFAHSHPTVSLCYETEYLQHTQDESGVTVTLRAINGDAYTVNAKWLVACDGANSKIRGQLDVPVDEALTALDMGLRSLVSNRSRDELQKVPVRYSFL